MSLKYFFLGFFIKIITGFDDTITKVPVLSSVTKTKKGKIAFSLGTLAAAASVIAISLSLSTFIKHFPYYRYLIAGLIFALAAAIYFDIFVHKPQSKWGLSILKPQGISIERFIKLVGIGFLVAFVTALDGIIAYSPLFLEGTITALYAIFGIFAAAILEIIVVFYFAEKINKIKYKEEVASAGLVILGILILTGVI